MKKKQLFALALSVLMLVAVLAGCSDPNATSTAPAAPASTAASTAAAAPADSSTAEPSSGSGMKVAWICESSMTDGGWNEDGFAAMQALAEKYNFELSYQEDVASTDVADVLRNYAASGYELVLSNEQYHCEDMATVAPEFPEVTFGCVNGYVSADNMIAITGDMWQHIYLAGIMSGAVTESNKIGLITYSTDSNSALTMLSAYKAGAESINPDVEVIHVATGSFSDLAIGKEMGISLMDQGCDIILCNSGDCNPTVMQTCIDNEVYTISAIVDRNKMSADYVLGSAMLPPSNILTTMVNGYMDGTLTGSADVQIMGLAEGVEEFRINPDIKDKFDQSVYDAIDEATKEIIAGNITVDLP